MSNNNDQSSPREQGFSLVELLIVTLILSIMLSILSWIIVGVQRQYAMHRPRKEALNNASAAMDTMVRLLRMAGNNTTQQAIDPGVKMNGQYNSIRIRADWNPADGDLLDTYEDVSFFASNGILFKQERPVDNNSPVPLLENIGSLKFTSFDKDGNQLADAAMENGKIALVRIELETLHPGSPPMRFSSSAHVRKRY